MVVYRKALHAGGKLKIDGLRDYATVFSGGQYLDYLSRVHKPGLHDLQEIAVPAHDKNADAELAILVDSFGHVGYGQAMYDRKGILGSIQLDQHELQDWNAQSLPLDETYLATLKPLKASSSRPGLFFKAKLKLDQLGDTYIDMSAWNKGYVWVNRRLLGRYWHIGPQQRLYCPASWLQHGDNEVLVFDMHRTTAAPIHGVDKLSG